MIKLIRFVNSRVEVLFKLRESLVCAVTGVRQAQADRSRLARGNCQFVICGCFSARLFGINSVLIAVNDVVVDPVFEVMGTINEVEEPLSVRVVLGEEQLRIGVAVQPAFTELTVIKFDSVLA